VAVTGLVPGGPTASICVTPAKPLPVIVKSLGVLGLAVFGLPWLLTARAAQRKLEMDRALVPFTDHC